ncbi:MAG: hypothetical protein QOD27_344 [Microbacteriaceae bacterium]|jgi:hypothetical protein|nr:hypothetical protein [Microbacteriaceae bacterium]
MSQAGSLTNHRLIRGLLPFVAIGHAQRRNDRRMWPWVIVGAPVAYLALVIAALVFGDGMF